MAARRFAAHMPVAAAMKLLSVTGAAQCSSARVPTERDLHTGQSHNKGIQMTCVTAELLHILHCCWKYTGPAENPPTKDRYRQINATLVHTSQQASAASTTATVRGEVQSRKPSLLLLAAILVVALNELHQSVAVLPGGHVAQAGAHTAEWHLHPLRSNLSWMAQVNAAG